MPLISRTYIALLVGLSALCVACTPSPSSGTSEGPKAASAAPAVKVGLVLDKGGRDDKSFNSSAFEGFTRAKKDFGIPGKMVEATDDNSFEPMLQHMARKDFNLIIAIGVSQAEAVKKVASRFPNKKFAIVDAKVDAPNVRSLLFQEHEGSYLVGALAALTSKTGKIGFIGGMDIPLIRRFELGYEAGARAVNPKIQISSNYVGVTGDAWNNPAKGKELALSQYSSGADVIFAAAGASGNGLFDAAEEKKLFAIGCDSNQNWIKPGYVLTSMMKRVDVAVYDVISEFKDGEFTGGVKRYGLVNQGIDYAMDKYNAPLVSASTQAKVDQLKAQIIAGKLQVPDYYMKKSDAAKSSH
jgi:basic membrane protein A